ncbi:DUF3231 family protein [Bacillus alkalicellulosilyticus]|uniref:DUF3231 family protein n=1 Tax=Alkalihalobacterium alkalicellulosilyticum TaxID=1912214 RepID=UPI001482B84F|nr:DUF3231 family protein [Bacillus alkalicellulosilyticus]
MTIKTKVKLTSSEIASLWSQYINDTATKQIVSYFLKNVDDEDVRTVLEQCLEKANCRLGFLVSLYKQENFPEPIGFTQKDVNLNAPRLYTDLYYLLYLQLLTVLGLTTGSLAFTTASRMDVVDFYQTLLIDSMELQRNVKKIELEKGTYYRPPSIPFPEEVSFVTEQNYLGTMIGKQRSVNSIEITHLFYNIQSNLVGKSLMIGFAQTCQSNKLRQFFLRGKEIADKHITIFTDILQTNDLPAPSPWDVAVTKSQVAPFSDKLMLFHVSGMVTAGIGNYGLAISASQRRDIGLRYARLLTEITAYAEDSANLMIKNGWLEQPPQAPDRDKLTQDT